MKDDSVFLRHILDAIRRINTYTQGDRQAFFDQPIVQDAVMRNLEIIGEAVKNLSPAFRTRYPGLPWAQIAGMRDVLIHAYFGVHLETVWNVVEKRLPDFEGCIRSFLEEPSL